MLLETSEVDFLHHIGARMASGELHEVLDRVVAFVTQLSSNAIPALFTCLKKMISCCARR